jgi:hypothetical protein
VASLAIKILNGFVLSMPPISDQGMARSISDLEVETIGMGASVTVGVMGFLTTARAFALGVRDNGSKGSMSDHGRLAERTIFWGAWA